MRKILLAIALLTTLSVCAQNRHGAGLLLEKDIEKKIPQKARLMTRDYTTLPKSHSLKAYCPSIEDQGQYSTCTGWASGYAARTIAEAVRQGWKGTSYITSEAFSPMFVYGNIKQTGTTNCDKGTNISQALRLMKETGIVKKRSFDALCVNTVSNSLKTEAAKYKIDDYFLIFSSKHTTDEAVTATKKAIAEGCPVVICCMIQQSLYTAGAYYICKETGSTNSYHAMCVVGYDDTKYGGAFEIMNSWGSNWGDRGYTWMDYKTYSRLVDHGVELYLKPKSTTTTTKTTTTTTTEKTFTHSGNVSLKLSTGEKLKATLGTSNGFKRYRLTEPLTSGTRYRIYISNNEPGYVYVFSGDNENNVAVNFPQDKNTSAALTYKTNDIALPSERTWLELDDTRGTDYVCVLFSKYNVDITSLLNHLKNGKGNFYEKVQSGFGKYLVNQGDIQFKSGAMGFNATSTGAIVPLLIEFNHN